MNSIADIRTISDAEAGALVSADTLAGLAASVTAVDVSERPRRGALRRRRWMSAAAVAVCLAAGAVLFGTSRSGTPGIGPATAQALNFTSDGRYLIVTVRDPLTDPARYRAEFAAHHLNIKLKLVPASPSIVGAVVYSDGGRGMTPITARGRCFTGGGGDVCPVGVRVAVNYRGSAEIVFGRAARPGEQYESAGQATAPGEALHGVAFRGRTVAAVEALLRARHTTVPQFRLMTSAVSDRLIHRQVPGDWYVYDAIPWAPGQMLLFVAPSRIRSVAPPAPGRCIRGATTQGLGAAPVVCPG